MLYNKEKLKGIRKCIIKSFAFYYNNYYPIYQEAKYSASYQLQEPKLDAFKGIKEADLLQKIDQDLIAIFNKVLIVLVLQEYIRAAKKTKREVLVAAYQGLENY